MEHDFAGALLELVGRVFLQKLDRVMRKLRPADRVNLAKERGDFRLPAPPVVAGKLEEFVVDALVVFRHERFRPPRMRQRRSIRRYRCTRSAESRSSAE